MRILVLGLPTGIIFAVLFGMENATYSHLLLLVLACFGLSFARSRTDGSSRDRVSYFLLIFVIACGWSWGGLANRDLSPWSLSSQPFFIVGTVKDVPVHRFHRQQVRIQLDCVGTRPGYCEQYHRIWWHMFWRHRPIVEVGFPEELYLEPGSRVQFSARFRPLKKRANPGAFDGERWMRSNHLVAHFSLMPNSKVDVLDRSPYSIDRFRVSLQRHLRTLRDADVRPDLSGYAVLLALITGDRSLMSTLHWDIFNRTGTTHLVAISGLHIGLVAAFAVFMTMPLFRRWRWFTNRYPASHGAILLALASALIYAAVAGFALPTQRAVIMLMVFVGLRLLGRVQQLWFSLSLAFCLTLIWDPLSCLSIGFWLSFFAVYLIIWVVGGRVVAPSQARVWLRVQFGLMLGLAPLLLWQVHATSLVSMVTNLIAVPLVGFLIVPLALIWAFIWAVFGWPAELLLQCLMTLIGAMIWMLEHIAAWDWSVWAVGAQPWLTMLLAIVGILWLFSKGIPGRFWGVILFLPALVPLSQGYGLYVLQDDNLRMAIRLSGRVLFVSNSHWPEVLPKWHKTLLQQWGVPVTESVIPLQAGAALWQASGLVLTEYKLEQSWLGQMDIESIRYVDLCAMRQPIDDGMVIMAAHLSPFEQKDCALQWVLGDQRGLYWPTASVRLQSYLLKNWQTPYSVASAVDADIDLLILMKKSNEKIDPKLDEILEQGSQIVLAGSTEGSFWLLQKQHEQRIHSLDQSGYFFLQMQEH